MKIGVIGAGALGSAIAASLTAAGRDVVLVARGPRLKLLAATEVELVSGGTSHRVKVKVVDANSVPGAMDLFICCVKAPDLEAGLAPIAGKLAEDAVLLTVQNGVESHEVAASLAPNASIAASRIHGFFEMEGDLIRHVGVQPSVLFGCTKGNVHLTNSRIIQAFAGSIFNAEVSPDIQKALWEKFMLAASLGTVALALKVPAGQVCAQPAGQHLLRSAMNEIKEIAGKAGVQLSDADADRTLAFIQSFPPDATTSLQRDVEQGRVSETDALTGAVLRLAKQFGVELSVFPGLARQSSGVIN